MDGARRITIVAVVAVATLLSTLPASAQKSGVHRESGRATNMELGDGEEVDLFTLTDNLDYEDKLVTTRARFEPLLEFERNNLEHPIYLLTTGRVNVLAVLGYGIVSDDLRALIGADVVVRGVVRWLRLGRASADLAQYPNLPKAPDPRPGLPTVSITMLSISRSRAPGEEKSLGQARRILAEPELFTGKKVQIIGLFRGRNLFADLPASSRRNDSDWVLKDGEISVWVSGRKPQGKGFSLDPTAPGDAAKWLAVEGQAEVVDGTVYLKATRVTLSRPPKP